MKFYVYIIESEVDGSYYVGHTGVLEDRLLRHNNMRSTYTSAKAPWKLVYTESYLSKAEAVKREREIKTKKSKKYIELLISLKG
jgi:putative endonuclease